MPDWSYHPVFRPLLFRMSAERGRDLTLGAMGRLAAMPGGRRVIQTMGHMTPSDRLQKTLWGVTFPTPVGLGAGVDERGRALQALAEFGFGVLEWGPVAEENVTVPNYAPIERVEEQEAILYPHGLAMTSVEQVEALLQRLGRLKVSLAIRLGNRPGADAEEAAAERVRVMERLAADAAFFALDTTEMIAQGGWQKEAWERHLETVARAAREQRIGKPLVLCVAPDMETEMLHRLVAPALRLGVQGVMVTGGVEATVRQALADAIDCETVQASEKQVEGERQTNQEPQPQELRTSTRARLIGLPTREATLNTVREIRARYGTDCPILASGGVHEPQDALELMAAGADLVLVDSGLVYSGPGLPKRINEAIEWQQERNEQREPLLLKKPEPTRNKPSTLRSSQAPTPRTFFQKSGWFWIQWLGLGMIVGGILAWLIAATVVVLPYDVEFLRLGREGIAAINERLLYFMAHDRISLAGTMISIGVLYFGLARYAMRRGEQWARTTVLASAAVGFASFFLYLGYGYFDPLHAAVALLLLPLFLLGLVKNNPRAPRPAPNLRNTAVWKRSLVGQLLFVSFGAGLLLSGLVISGVGVTDVFVQEDLNYLCTTSNSLQAANPNLVPLIAHDRAGFGGALVSDGIAYLLLSLWGFRQGEKWLWWTLLFGGFAGFFAVFSTHWYVGYLDQWHLAPAYLALLLYGAGLILTYPFLTRPRR